MTKARKQTNLKANLLKNCDLRLENAARGRRARAALSRPCLQFFTKGTGWPITNIASGSEIKKQGRVTPAITISFYSGAERCKKIKREHDNSR